MLGGQIHIASTPGVGTTFTVTVATGPLDGVELCDPQSEVDDEAPRLQLRAANAQRPLAGVHLLVVEDGADNQRLISLHLTRAGAAVDVLGNGQLAVERLTSAELPPYDIVLMDMQMPILDGYAATATLRSMGYAGPIIALTAHAMEGDRQKCLAAGCDEYTTKPIQYEKIVSLILAQTSRARMLAMPIAQLMRHDDLPEVRQLLAAVDSVPTNANASPPMIVSTFQDDPEMAELVEMFVGSLPERVTALENTHAAGDLADLARTAHQLKGAGGGYGFLQITEAAERLETALHAQVPAAQVLEALRQLVEVLRSARFEPARGDAEPNRATAAGASAPWPVRS
jgi:CheY-like chemotaxis protein